MDIDVRRIYERLDEAEVGDSIDYETLNQIIGRSVQNGARSVLVRAIRRQLRERSRLWLVVRNEGVKLASDSDVATAIPEESRLKLSRLTKRQARKLAAIRDFDSLPREQKTGVLAAQSFLGAIATFTKPSSVKQLESSIEKQETPKSLPLAKTIEVFMK